MKADRNSYTGIEWLPSVRAGWRPGTDNLAWAAVSRAVRVPSRLDRELYLPGAPPFLLAGGPAFRSEVSWVYELGYRGQPAPRFSWAATAFYHDHDRQRSVAPGIDGATVENDVVGHTAGIEAWGAFRLTDAWRLYGGYTYLDKELHVRPGEVDLQQDIGRGSDPRQWAKLRSSLDVGESVELDLMLRFYDRLENRGVPAYVAVDGRLGWAVTHRVELSALVRNLTDDGHIEWAPGEELERTFFLKALVRF